MKLLNIKLPVAPILIEPKPLVLSLIKNLFMLRNDYAKKTCSDEIQKYWGALSLSASFELIFLAFIDRIRLDSLKKDKFLDDIGSFKMHEFLRKNHWATERAGEIVRRRSQLLTVSSIRMADIFLQDARLEQELQSLEWALSPSIVTAHSVRDGMQRCEPLPSMFNLIVQIVLILEELGKLSEETTALIKSQLIADYSLFMRKLAPLFCAVQKITINDSRAFRMNSLDVAIEEVVNFLGFQEEGCALAAQVKAMLFEKKYLQVDEAIQQYQFSI